MPEDYVQSAGELRARLARCRARWSVLEHLADEDPLPRPALGLAAGARPVTAAEAGLVDLRALVGRESANPHLTRRRAAHGLLPPGAQRPGRPGDPYRSETPYRRPGDPYPQAAPATRVRPATQAAAEAPAAPAAPTPGGLVAVDWRSRWGRPWITKVKDQNPCAASWAFAAAGLVESMARIEHGVWAKRSEGDVHDGLKSACGQGSDPEAALDWIRDSGGLADPGCWPYSPPPAGLPAERREAWRAEYTPSWDRSGRTVRITGHVRLGDTGQQKVWLDAVGPLIACLDVYEDFFGLGSGVYHRTGGRPVGGHCVLITGYDDAAGCWLFKNSWGTGHHVDGHGRIAYGEAGVDHWAKYGVSGTSIDPWSKRRLHAGNVYESGNGRAHRNFELLATATAAAIPPAAMTMPAAPLTAASLNGHSHVHGAGPGPGATLAPAAAIPAASVSASVSARQGSRLQHWWRDGDAPFRWSRAAVFARDASGQPSLTSTTYNRNMESLHVTPGGRLRHWYYEQSRGTWRDGGAFGPGDAAVGSTPALIQSDYGKPGNLEAVVRTADGRLNHWWRINGAPWTWNDGGRFASGIAHYGPALVQTRGRHLDLVATRADARMQLWWRDDASNGFVWRPGEVFGSGITSAPCLIESQHGASDEDTAGNYELCVTGVGGRIEHWWRPGSAGSAWRRGGVFGHDALTVTGMLQGSFGFNLEVVALRTDRRLQHYWRDGAGWHEGPVIGPV
ncbi:C1 family peptidase [Streptomyces sp. NPDC051567]|uniref:C1 family peptidase n=1 Tax=Streptomyces sp. NPDC051567 TaxID=3365660 RepID=UPI0037880794